MDSIFESYKTKKVKAIKGDFIDKLHSQITVTFLFTILILVALKQTGDTSIYCWYPKFLSGPQGDYVHQFCWINSTYLYLDEDDPQKFIEHPKTSIPYYQFMLFILFGQCFLFYIPSLLWSVLASDSTGYIDKLLEAVDKSRIISAAIKQAKEVEKDTQNTEQIQNQDLLPKIDEVDSESDIESSSSNSHQSISRQTSINRPNIIVADESKTLVTNTFKGALNRNDDEIHKAKIKEGEKLRKKLLKAPKILKKRLMNPIRPINGVKGLTIKYLLLKIFNLSNIIIQVIFLQFIFGKEFLIYGLTYFHKVWHTHNPLILTRQFPYFSLCDYYVHMPSMKVHETTVQCLLAINVLIEKFYVLIWFWYLILFIVTLWNLLSWIYEIYLPSKAKFLHKYMEIYRKMYNNNESSTRDANRKSTEDEKQILLNYENEETVFSEFEKYYLGTDGLVMLLILKAVAGDITFMELLHSLWEDYLLTKTKKA